MAASSSSSSSTRLTIDPMTWIRCAGFLPFNPVAESLVYYFPEGHAEQLHQSQHFDSSETINEGETAFLCKIKSITYLADAETDEVMAEIRLKPLENSPVFDRFEIVQENTAFFTRTIVQSDFLDKRLYLPDADSNLVFPPHLERESVRSLELIDFGNKSWSIKHRRAKTRNCYHLTEGWHDLYTSKGLIEGDAMVFMKAEQGIKFGFQRSGNQLANSYINSDENEGIEGVKKCIRHARKLKSFRVKFFPNWVNFLVDPYFRLECNARLTIKNSRVRKRITKVEGVLTKAILSDKFGWKNVEVCWEKNGALVNENPWDIEPSKRVAA